MSGAPQTIIIGAGPAGLAVGAALRKKAIPFAILEQSERVAATWRNHYERLHLHTPAASSSLPFRRFPRECERYPARVDVIDYLERYAEAFDLRPEFSTTITHCRRAGSDWIIASRTGAARHARNLVIACGLNRVPLVPHWHGQEAFAGPIIHGSSYRNGEAFRGKRVLVIGFGNSGAEIAIDLHEHGAVPTISMRTPASVVPRDVLGVPITQIAVAARHLPRRVADAISALAVRFVLGDLSRCGLPQRFGGALADVEQRRRIPVIDVGTVDLIRRGSIHLRGAVDRFDGHDSIFADATRERFDAVILATGYATGLSTLLPDQPDVLDRFDHPCAHGRPAAAGLYFCGFNVVPTGLLREIGHEALAIAADISARGETG